MRRPPSALLTNGAAASRPVRASWRSRSLPTTADEDARHPEVLGHFDPGHGWDPYAGVAHVPAEDVGDFPAELLVEPLDPFY